MSGRVENVTFASDGTTPSVGGGLALADPEEADSVPASFRAAMSGLGYIGGFVPFRLSRLDTAIIPRSFPE